VSANVSTLSCFKAAVPNRNTLQTAYQDGELSMHAMRGSLLSFLVAQELFDGARFPVHVKTVNDRRAGGFRISASATTIPVSISHPTSAVFISWSTAYRKRPGNTPS
jgi:hypothetical protein